jgi:NAD(P)H-dependent nitrite reductase small subunit
MDDAAALPLQFRGTAKHLKSGFAPHIVHPLCDPVFRIQLQSIDFLANKMTQQYNIGPGFIMREGHVTGKWVRVASLSELPSQGLGHAVKADGLDIAIFRWDDRVYAIEDLCPHLGFPLSEGILQDGEVICSWHGWHVRLEDGTCRRERERAKVWECEVRDGEIFVKI